MTQLEASRVALFVDGQNCYMGARRAYCGDAASARCGQVDPHLLGHHLCARSDVRRSLVGVRIYRGLPSEIRDPRGHRAAQRQVAAWQRLPLVDAWTRPLSYGPDGTAREKGVDTKLAVDMVLMAQRNEFDVAVLFSDDTDFLPALEAVIEIKGTTAACEVATWVSPRNPRPRATRLSGQHIRLHALRQDEYRQLSDRTDYARGSRRR